MSDDFLDISTHTLTWSVTLRSIRADNDITHFNSHAHVERDSRQAVGLTAVRHFNSHAHVERDPQGERVALAHSISTHTLTWSVTDMAKHYPYHR